MELRIALGCLLTLLSLGMLFSFWRHPSDKPDLIALLNAWRNDFGIVPFMFVNFVPLFTMGTVNLMIMQIYPLPLLGLILPIVFLGGGAYLRFVLHTKKGAAFENEIAAGKVMSFIRRMSFFYFVYSAWNIYRQLV